MTKGVVLLQPAGKGTRTLSRTSGEGGVGWGLTVRSRFRSVISPVIGTPCPTAGPVYASASASASGVAPAAGSSPVTSAARSTPTIVT